MTRAVRWMFEDRSTGRIVVGQWPNPPLWVWLVATMLRWFVEGTTGDVLSVIGSLALAVWAVLEVARGVNPFRRVLGAIVLVGLLVRLV